ALLCAAASDWRGHCHLHPHDRPQTVRLMRILICSDGMPASAPATRLGGLVASACRAETVVLGIAEKPADEPALRSALAQEVQSLKASGLMPRIVIGGGEPIREILSETSKNIYDLVVIGAQRKGRSGL